MKNIFESPEIFTAYAIIDYCYYMLDEIRKEKPKLRSSIEIEIDRVTGYTKHKNKETIKTAISLLKEVIKQKKIIEADYTNDEKTLKQLQDLKVN